MGRSNPKQLTQTVVLRARGHLLLRALGVFFAGAIAALLMHGTLAREAPVGEAPDFALKSTAGANYRLTEFQSEVVALVFWAGWCGECRAQLAVLDRLQRQFGTEGLQVLSVNLDRDAEAARQAAAADGVAFPVLHDEGGETGRVYGLRELPTLVLIDREGRIRARHEGIRALQGAQVSQQIRALLDE